MRGEGGWESHDYHLCEKDSTTLEAFHLQSSEFELGHTYNGMYLNSEVLTSRLHSILDSCHFVEVATKDASQCQLWLLFVI